MKRLIRHFISDEIRQKIKSTHFYNRRIAKLYVSSSKRLDLCAAQFANILHLSNYPSLKDKICLEIGSGWVLSHALICYLLGAKRIVATDIVPLACPRYLHRAVHNAVPSIIRDILSPFAEHTELRDRLNKLLSIKKYDVDTLKSIGIQYIAPIDLCKETLSYSVDFIYSFSVLQVVPLDEVQQLLTNLIDHLYPDGSMIHCIHLEDQKDFEDAPFAFLSESSDSYTARVQRWQGNRIRRSHWNHLFSLLDDVSYKILYEWTRNDKSLPQVIDPSITYMDEEDLRVSHLGVICTRKSILS